MPHQRSVTRVLAGVFIGLALVLCASTGLGQSIGKSKVYRVSLEKVELYLDTAAATGVPGSVTARPGLAKAELRLGLADMQLASEELRMMGYAKAAIVPAFCPVGWYHMHLGGCPREALAACTTICWAHPDCGATMSWTPGRLLCTDECNCFPDGS
jgi:hypothetical protein